jgi:Ca2+-binding EF-hand superfamily protein
MINDTPVVAEVSNADTTHGDLYHVDSIALSDSAVLGRSDSSAHLASSDIMDYDLESGDITPEKVQEIKTVYEKEGKLNVRSVQFIIETITRRFKRMPNISRVALNTDSKVTVVGDLHGHLDDLIRIIDDAGWPSSSHSIVFNGGFIDRGVKSVEVIVLIMAMKLAYPDNVFLNKGNHEDKVLSNVYGFQKECTAKYDAGLYLLFGELFNHIPLFTLLNDTVLIVHAGLFHHRNVTLTDLDDIIRMDYKPEPENPKSEKNKNNSRGLFLRRLQQDALWSDPHLTDVVSNHRSGMGVMFGPSHTLHFLNQNNLKFLIRSHEAVSGGFDLPFKGTPAESKLCTVFSTSNYNNTGSRAGYLVLYGHSVQGESVVKIEDCDIWYRVYTFSTNTGEELKQQKTERLLHELILKRWNALQIAFVDADKNGTGIVSRLQWSNIMRTVTRIDIMWISMIPVLVAPDALHNMGHEVNYSVFLDRYKQGSEDQLDMKNLYSQRKKLEAIFRYFDSDGNGSISKAEFKRGCAILNRNLPIDRQIMDPDGLMKLMDFDGNDSVDMNEFFEVRSQLGIGIFGFYLTV